VAQNFEGQGIEMRLDAALVDGQGEIQIIPHALSGF
jgi:hypothetical protein